MAESTIFTENRIITNRRIETEGHAMAEDFIMTKRRIMAGRVSMGEVGSFSESDKSEYVSKLKNSEHTAITAYKEGKLSSKDRYLA